MVKKQICVIWITYGFIICITTDDICKDTVEDVETRFDTSNFELDRLLPKGKNK